MINFEDTINYQAEILRYAGKSSDNFTVITIHKKPYSKRPPNFVHDKIMMDFPPYNGRLYCWYKKMARAEKAIQLCLLIDYVKVVDAY